MKAHLKNKVGIITGASKGIGRKLVFLLASEKCRLLLVARSEAILQELKDDLILMGHDVAFVSGDISDPGTASQVAQAALQHWGRIDFLINAAGISSRGFFEELAPKVMKRLMEVNTLGPAYITQKCLPYIVEAHGSIIFISSFTGLRGLPSNSMYSASKMTHTAIAEAIRTEATLSHKELHIGVVYLDITENDPGKKVMGPSGRPIVLKNRKARRALTQDFVAAEILDGLIHKRKLILPGTFAKIFYFFNRHFPFIVEFIISLFRKRLKELAR